MPFCGIQVTVRLFLAEALFDCEAVAKQSHVLFLLLFSLSTCQSEQRLATLRDLGPASPAT
jgi:hypothetical protein